jgi:hypothetical protein
MQGQSMSSGQIKVSSSSVPAIIASADIWENYVAALPGGEETPELNKVMAAATEPVDGEAG